VFVGRPRTRIFSKRQLAYAGSHVERDRPAACFTFTATRRTIRRRLHPCRDESCRVPRCTTGTSAAHRHRNLFQVLLIERGGGEMTYEAASLPFEGAGRDPGGADHCTWFSAFARRRPTAGW